MADCYTLRVCVLTGTGTPDGSFTRFDMNCRCWLCQYYPTHVIGHYVPQSGAPHAQAMPANYLVQEVQSNQQTTSRPSGRVPCTHCSSTFTRKRDMDRHVLTAHPPKDSTKYYCHHPDCMRSTQGFPRRDARDSHEKNKCDLMKQEPWFALRDPRERAFPPRDGY